MNEERKPKRRTPYEAEMPPGTVRTCGKCGLGWVADATVLEGETCDRCVSNALHARNMELLRQQYPESLDDQFAALAAKNCC